MKLKKSNRTIVITPIKFLFLLMFFSGKGYSQTTKVSNGDTITSEFVLWNKDEYKPNANPKLKLACINKNGDTLSLVKYIGMEFDYPKFCVEMGVHPYKMWYKIILDSKGKLKNLDALRMEQCKEVVKEQLTEILNRTLKIISKKEMEFVLEIKVKVIPAPLKEMPAIKPIEIRRH